MRRFFQTTRASLAGLALAGAMSNEAAAQFVTANNFQQQQPTYQAAPPAYGQPASSYYQQAQLAPPTYGYPRVAQAGDLPAPAEAVKADAAQAAAPVTPAPPMTAPAATYTAPAPQASYAAPAAAMPYNGGYEQAASHTTYQAAPTATVASSGCATGDCGATSPAPAMAAPVANYGTSYAAPADCGYGSAPAVSYSAPCYSGAPSCDLGIPAAPSRQWFGGFYGLFMQRDDPGKSAAVLIVEDVTAITTPYYAPTSGTNASFLFTSDAQVDGQFGGEVRFGSTFGADPCNCNQMFAWEVGYWGLEEDESQATALMTTPLGPTNNRRLYGQINYAGLEYDRDGAGATYAYRPINEYMDYQIPVENAAPNDIRVVGQRLRQSFQAQNLELNFWRFGTPTTGASLGGGRLAGGLAGVRGRLGAGGSACGGYGAGSCGTGSCGTGSCGIDACGGGYGCGPAACAPCRPPRRFFINGLAGLRYFRMDEDWQNAVQFSVVDPTTNTPNAGEHTQYSGGFPPGDDATLFHDIETDNRLIGFQLGCSMNWLVGCKWNFFADSNFGVYNNDINVYQRVYNDGGGVVRFVGDGTSVAVRSSRNEVATIGELRLGVGYQVSCNCRLTAAYRLMGVSGVALAVEQVQGNFQNRELLSHIDGNDSILLHGLQTGVEFKY